jgi:hypothetical protein
MATLAVEVLEREALFQPPLVAPRPDPMPDLRLVETPAAQAPVVRPAPAEAFDADLPAGLFLAMFGLFGAFLLLMFATFAGADAMGVIGVICAICLLGYFGVPWALHKVAPRPLVPRDRSMGRLLREGVAAGEGHRTCGRDAIGLVLLLPAIIMGWGAAVAIIRAIVL